MKITIGGMMGFKIQGKQYESIDASSVFTIEKEFDDDTSFDIIEKLTEKTTKALERDSTNKLKAAIEQYKGKVEKLKGLLYGT